MKQCLNILKSKKGVRGGKVQGMQSTGGKRLGPPCPLHPICANNHISAQPHPFNTHTAISN